MQNIHYHWSALLFRNIEFIVYNREESRFIVRHPTDSCFIHQLASAAVSIHSVLCRDCFTLSLYHNPRSYCSLICV